jgi:hypothetical protein
VERNRGLLAKTAPRVLGIEDDAKGLTDVAGYDRFEDTTGLAHAQKFFRELLLQ